MSPKVASLPVNMSRANWQGDSSSLECAGNCCASTYPKTNSPIPTTTTRSWHGTAALRKGHTTSDALEIALKSQPKPSTRSSLKDSHSLSLAVVTEQNRRELEPLPTPVSMCNLPGNVNLHFACQCCHTNQHTRLGRSLAKSGTSSKSVHFTVAQKNKSVSWKFFRALTFVFWFWKNKKKEPDFALIYFGANHE